MERINRQQQPDIKAIDQINLLKPTHYQLDNGLRVHQINAGTQDIVKIEFVFQAGICQQKKKLSASLTNKMMTEGTKSFSSFEIAESIDKYGAFIGNTVDKDYSSISLYSLHKHLPKLFPIFQEIILHPIFPEKEFGVLSNKLKQEFFVNQEKVKHLAQTNLMQLIYGKRHAYGQMSTINDYEQIKLSDIKSFHRAKYSLNQCQVFISGRIPKDFQSQLNNYFGDHSSFSFEENKNSFEVDTSSTSKHKILKKNAMQSAIRIGKPLFNLHHPDFIGLQVVNTILGGYFGSRLMSNIREDKGYTYGIGSAVYSLKHSGLFSISTEVGSEFVEAAIEEIYKEIDLLQTQLVSPEELSLVKNYILGQMIRSMDGPFSMHEKLKAVILQDIDLSQIQKRIDIVTKLQSEEIRDLANRHFKIDSLIELVVGS